MPDQTPYSSVRRILRIFKRFLRLVLTLPEIVKKILDLVK